MHQHLAKAAKKNKAWQAVQMLVLPSPVNGLFRANRIVFATLYFTRAFSLEQESSSDWLGCLGYITLPT
jgi:hypothetical protein